MAYIGMLNPVAAPVDTETMGSAITYGTGMIIGPAVAANLNLDVADNPDYGDDIIIDNDNGNNTVIIGNNNTVNNTIINNTVIDTLARTKMTQRVFSGYAKKTYTYTK